jgi:hypothetical protein
VAKFEWIIIELLVIGLLGREVFSIRRTIRRDREKQRMDKDNERSI